MRIITQSDTSDEAVRRFEASMAKLRTLDVTDGYVRQLSEVGILRYALFVLYCMGSSWLYCTVLSPRRSVASIGSRKLSCSFIPESQIDIAKFLLHICQDFSGTDLKLGITD